MSKKPANKDWSRMEEYARRQLERTRRFIDESGSLGTPGDAQARKTWKRRVKRKDDV